jgi:aldose 1-epimerase
MALSGQQYPIVAGDHEATIAEVGATLRRYTRRGRDVVEPFGTDEVAPHSAGAVLVPWPNRIRAGKYTFAGEQHQLPLAEPRLGNAIHGLVRWVRWRPVTLEKAAVTLATELVPQPGWPHVARVEVRYAMDAEQGLTVTTTARNDGPDAAPFGAGFHPYLSLHGYPIGEATVVVPARTRLVGDAAQIPVGEEPVDGTPYDLREPAPLGERRLDDAFAGLTGRSAEVLLPDGSGARVWYDESFGYLQVFTQPEFAERSQAVAIEPMTCPADAFNSAAGLIVLEPGQSWTGTWGITPLG